jgi:hypothetical protein
MAFGLGKLNTLQTKLDIYEDLSKEMLSKLESAVSSIQENTNKTAIILERHENRLDEGDKANTAIIKLIERVEQNLDDLETKVDEMQKFMWMGAAGLSTLVLILQLLPTVGLSLTPQKTSAIMSETHFVHASR